MKRVMVLALALAGCADLTFLDGGACTWRTEWREPAAEGPCLKGEADENTRLRFAGEGCGAWRRELYAEPGDTIEAGVLPGERVEIGSITWTAVECESLENMPR